MAKRRRGVYDRKWFVVPCGVVNDGEPCWCRLIVTSDYDSESDRIDDCVIRSGEVDEKLANHIVKVHNESLKAKRKLGNIERSLMPSRIAKLEAALESYRWIPVGERLPDQPPQPLAYSDQVLSYSKTGRVRVDKYVHKRNVHKQNVWLSGRKDVTHWQEIILPRHNELLKAKRK